jgi:hypothetical protein
MKAIASLLVSMSLAVSASAAELSAVPDGEGGDLSGADDFDFLLGEWLVHHRIQRPAGTGEWVEFEGTHAMRGLMEGRVNVEEHRFERPTGVTYGVALRSYDPKTAEWAIWWVDSRVPHNAMDPPMKGRFVDGVGTFYSDSTLDGKPVKVRFHWTSDPAPRWEQAYSHDGGKTWQVNWIMEFRRAEPGKLRVQDDFGA